MTRYVGVHGAESHLPELLELTAGGEEVAITRRGDEIARLVPAASSWETSINYQIGKLPPLDLTIIAGGPAVADHPIRTVLV